MLPKTFILNFKYLVMPTISRNRFIFTYFRLLGTLNFILLFFIISQHQIIFVFDSFCFYQSTSEYNKSIKVYYRKIIINKNLLIKYSQSMKNNYSSIKLIKSLQKKQKKSIADQYFQKLSKAKSPDWSKINKKTVNKQSLFKFNIIKRESNQPVINSSKNNILSINSSELYNIPKENLQTFKKTIVKENNKQKILTIKSSSTSHLSINEKKSFSTINNQEKITQSTNHNILQQISNTIRIQPVQTLFLCTKCYEYFLYPQKNVHINYCQFQSSKTNIQQKLKRLNGFLQIISKKNPNPYTIAIGKKLLKYLNNEISLEDILILQWFIINSKVNVGIIWSELFWVIQKLGMFKQAIQQSQKINNVFWMLCK